jgi:MoaA/NifB/PqqE/SkfB family radical SAM enzyme
MLSHLITNRCNATCAFCPWRFPSGDELTTEEIAGLYQQAARLGFPLNFIWGGEPLLREDLTEVVRFSQSRGMSTSVFTNGYLLPQHNEFARHSDAIILSLDTADETHDSIRGREGLFKNAVQGIEMVKAKYPNVEILINCLLSRLNRGQIPGIMELSKEIGVTVFFAPVLYDERFPSGDTTAHIPQLGKSAEELREDYLLIRDYKTRGYPVNNSTFATDYFVEKGTSYPCCWPMVCVTIYPDGSLEDCMTRTFFADIRQQRLRAILKSSHFKTMQSKARRCKQACVNLDSIEASGVWQLQWESVRNYHGVFRPKERG